MAFLSGVASLDEARECAGRLCQAVSRIPDLDLKGCGLSCSIGGLCAQGTEGITIPFS